MRPLLLVQCMQLVGFPLQQHKMKLAESQSKALLAFVTADIFASFRVLSLSRLRAYTLQQATFYICSYFYTDNFTISTVKSHYSHCFNCLKFIYEDRQYPKNGRFWPWERLIKLKLLPFFRCHSCNRQVFQTTVSSASHHHCHHLIRLISEWGRLKILCPKKGGLVNILLRQKRDRICSNVAVVMLVIRTGWLFLCGSIRTYSVWQSSDTFTGDIHKHITIFAWSNKEKN